MNSYETDNRWSPGSSGAIVPEAAPAAYSARWIDQGDNTPADVLPDRQGFAYNDINDRDILMALLNSCGTDLRTPSYTNIQRDKTTCIANPPEWQMWQRRTGGYIYVDAWLVPVTTEHHAACDDDGWDHPGECHLEAYDNVVVTEVPERTWQVRCDDGAVRHDQNFWTLAEAREFANHGHACLAHHLFVEVWS